MVKKGEISQIILSITFTIFTTLVSLFSSNFTQITNENSNTNLHNQINQIQTIQETTNKTLEIYFCPQENCHQKFSQTLNQSKSSIQCALHEFDNKKLSQLLIQKHKQNITITLIIEDKYKNELGLNPLKKQKIQIKTDGKNSKLMHHKFCIIDNKTIITGSTNPTENGFYKNNNNMLIIHSKQLAKHFQQEFNQLNQNKFQKQKTKLNLPKINLTTPNETYLIQTKFCPNKNCLNSTLTELQKSKKEILFANFVLTENQIENLLLQKSNQNITVKGLIEKRMLNIKGSKIPQLNQTFPIQTDTNKNTMHHKFFIIDEKTIITGSMNPTKSGTNGNDEHIIIIKNKNLAKKYKHEFYKLTQTP